MKYKLAESALPTSIDVFESYEIGIVLAPSYRDSGKLLKLISLMSRRAGI